MRYKTHDSYKNNDVDLVNYDISRSALRILQSFSTSSLLSDDNVIRLKTKEAIDNFHDNKIKSRIFRSVDEESIRRGIDAKPACRYEVLKLFPRVQHNKLCYQANEPYESRNMETRLDVILDIAHNEAALEALVAKIRRDYNPNCVRYDIMSWL
jgi:folylpolyglutamate synthase/dihydropteroate synthase